MREIQGEGTRDGGIEVSDWPGGTNSAKVDSLPPLHTHT